MCIAILQKKDAKPMSEESLLACFQSNRHGFGVAYFIERRLIIEKLAPLDGPDKFNFENIKEIYNRANAAKTSDLMVHFRLATAGLNDQANTHPFEVNPEMAMCHNGVISELSFGKVDYSDSWFLNEKFLKPNIRTIADLKNKNDFLIKFIDKLIGYSNKLVFVTPDDYYIWCGEGRGGWDHGIWYSNTSYKPYKSPTYSYDYTTYDRYQGLADDGYWKNGYWVKRNPVRKVKGNKPCEICGEVGELKRYEDMKMCPTCFGKFGPEKIEEKDLLKEEPVIDFRTGQLIDGTSYEVVSSGKNPNLCSGDYDNVDW